MVKQGPCGTLAPFVQPEKPQVFPPPAASFINVLPDIDMLEPIGRRPRSPAAQVLERRRRYGYACFDWDFCDDMTQPDGVSRLSESIFVRALRL
jgi:hypothetical protein